MRRGTHGLQVSPWLGVALAWMVGLSVLGCDPRPAPDAERSGTLESQTPEATDTASEPEYHIVGAELDFGGGFDEGEWPRRGPVECRRREDEEACRRGEDVLVRCLGCHRFYPDEPRRAPPLTGLLRQKRVFTSRQFVVADEAYIRRSIEDHQSVEEYVRGYKGSVGWNHPDRRQRESARKRQLDRWKSTMGTESLSPEEVDAVLMHVMTFARRPLLDARLTYELVGAEKPHEKERLRREIEARLESVEQCYRRELFLYPTKTGSLTLRLERLSGSEALVDRALEDMVQEDSLRDPDVARCALDAVDDIAGVMLYYEPVPQGTKVVFHFATK